MALFSTKNIVIRGVAACVPSKVVQVTDYSFFQEGEAKKIIESTGTERHRAVDENTCASDLCYYAAEKLIRELSWKRKEIDILIFSSVTRDYIQPQTASILQARLGLSISCAAFDMPVGCAGFIYSLATAAKLLSGGELKKAILLIGEINSVAASQEDKTFAPLMGDAGTAIAVEFDKTVKEKSYYHLASDGTGKDALIIEDGGYRNFFNKNSLVMKEIEPGVKRTALNVKMKGMDVMLFTISRAPESIKLCMDYAKKTIDNVDFFLLHQANKFILDRVCKMMKVINVKIPSNLQDYGNTGGASIPLLMVTSLNEELTKKKISMVCCGFGVGFNWGSAYITTDKIVCCDLIEI
jgi:3-oxoacyl-[acyl-carrier-protein] synthase-3